MRRFWFWSTEKTLGFDFLKVSSRARARVWVNFFHKSKHACLPMRLTQQRQGVQRFKVRNSGNGIAVGEEFGKWKVSVLGNEIAKGERFGKRIRERWGIWEIAQVKVSDLGNCSLKGEGFGKLSRDLSTVPPTAHVWRKASGAVGKSVWRGFRSFYVANVILNWYVFL